MSISHIERGHWKRLFREIGLLRVIEESTSPRKAKYMLKARRGIQHHWANINRMMRIDP